MVQVKQEYSLAETLKRVNEEWQPTGRERWVVYEDTPAWYDHGLYGGWTGGSSTMVFCGASESDMNDFLAKHEPDKGKSFKTKHEVEKQKTYIQTSWF